MSKDQPMADPISDRLCDLEQQVAMLARSNRRLKFGAAAIVSLMCILALLTQSTPRRAMAAPPAPTATRPTVFQFDQFEIKDYAGTIRLRGGVHSNVPATEMMVNGPRGLPAFQLLAEGERNILNGFDPAGDKKIEIQITAANISATVFGPAGTSRTVTFP
jgi:hypothetical protein